MKLTTRHLQQIVTQAKDDAPNETCGLIAGKKDCAEKVYALKNTSPTPQTNYYADPQELLACFQDMDAMNSEHLAIYHSHPTSPAYPSPTDLAMAYYPDAVYIIISLADATQVVVRAFRIVDTKISEVTLEIEEEHEPSRTNSRRAPQRADRPRARRAVAPLSKGRPDSRGTRRPRR
jgi:proteasome lid subunit RPN8/RPN11